MKKPLLASSGFFALVLDLGQSGQLPGAAGQVVLGAAAQLRTLQCMLRHKNQDDSVRFGCALYRR